MSAGRVKLADALVEIAVDLEGLETGMDRGRQATEQGVRNIKSALNALDRAVQTAGDTPPTGFLHSMRQMKSGASDAVSDVKRSLNSVGSAISNVGKGFAIFGLAANGVQTLTGAVSGLGNALLSGNAALEQSTVAFESLLGSADEARRVMADLRRFSAETPFEMPGIQRAARLLLAYRFEAEELVPILTDVGDAVAALGGGEFEMERVIRALGQMSAKGKVTAEDMMQLTELGINGFGILAEQMGISTAEVQALSSKGLIPAAEAIPLLRDGLRETFGGGMQAQARTFNGLLSTVKDNLREAFNIVTLPLFDQAKDALEEFARYIQTADFQQKVQDWAGEVTNLAGQIRTFVVEQGPGLVRFASDVKTQVMELAKEIGAIVGFVQTIIALLPDQGGPSSSPDDIPDVVRAQNVEVRLDYDKEAGDGLLDLMRDLDSFNPLGVRRTTDTVKALDNAIREFNEFGVDHEGVFAYAEAAELAHNRLYQLEQTIPPLSEEMANLSAEEIIAKQAMEESVEAAEARNRALLEQDRALRQSTDTQRQAATEGHRFNQVYTQQGQAVAQVTTYTEAMMLVHARARVALATVHDAAQDLANAYQANLRVMAEFQQQSGEYGSQLSAVETAFEELHRRQEAGLPLSEEQIAMLENEDEIRGRLQGAVQDANVQAGEAAAKNALLMGVQDELNQALKDGTIDQDEYNRRLDAAKSLYGDVNQGTENQKTANEELADVVNNNLRPAINDLARALEYIAKPWLVGIDIAAEAAEEELRRIKGLIDDINNSSVAPVNSQGQSGQGGQAFARGGLVNEPTFALIGEAGPELVLPLNNRQRMEELLEAAGIMVWAKGGGVVDPSAYGPNAGPAKHAGSVPITISVPSVDWVKLFQGLPEAASEAAREAADGIFGMFSDLDALFSGQQLQEAQAKLADMLTIRKISMDAGVGGSVIMEMNMQIAQQQAQVDAIGAFMGTQIAIQAAAAMKAGEISEALKELRRDVIQAFDLDDVFANRTEIEATIERLNVMRDAVADIGDQAQVDLLTADIVALEGELAIVNQLIGTDAVTAWQANKDAAQEATAAAQQWADTFTAIGATNGGEIDRLQERYRAAQIALQTAMLDPNTSPETLADLQASYDASLDALKRYQDAYELALDSGVFTQGELLEQAKSGGDELRMILERGLLSDEQIKSLYQSGDESIKKIIDHVFGADTMAALEASWNDITGAAFDQLVAFKPGVITEGWINQVTDALADGRIDVGQAMKLLVNESGEVADEEAISLINTYEQLQQSLRDALLSGEQTAIDAAQAQYDAFLAWVTDFAIANGLTVEEVLEDFEKIRTAAQQTASTLQGTSIGLGGPSGGGAFDLGGLRGLLESIVGDLDKTLTDNLIDLQQAAIDAGDYLNQSTVSELGGLLGKQLAQYGLSDPFSIGAAVLQQMGLTPEDLARMGLSQESIDDLQTGLGSDVLDGSSDIVEAIDRQTGQLVEALTGGASSQGISGMATAPRATVPSPYSGASGGAETYADGSASGRRPGARGTGWSGGDPLNVTLTLDGRTMRSFVIDTVTGQVQKEF